jgi:hypothetical protein
MIDYRIIYSIGIIKFIPYSNYDWYQLGFSKQKGKTWIQAGFSVVFASRGHISIGKHSEDKQKDKWKHPKRSRR